MEKKGKGKTVEKEIKLLEIKKEEDIEPPKEDQGAKKESKVSPKTIFVRNLPEDATNQI
jgi:hypothetical protein